MEVISHTLRVPRFASDRASLQAGCRPSCAVVGGRRPVAASAATANPAHCLDDAPHRLAHRRSAVPGAVCVHNWRGRDRSGTQDPGRTRFEPPVQDIPPASASVPHARTEHFVLCGASAGVVSDTGGRMLPHGSRLWPGPAYSARHAASVAAHRAACAYHRLRKLRLAAVCARATRGDQLEGDARPPGRPGRGHGYHRAMCAGSHTRTLYRPVS